MSATGLVTFDSTPAKTNGILKQIGQAYEWPKERRNQLYSALRAVLHPVRDRDRNGARRGNRVPVLAMPGPCQDRSGRGQSLR
ncbi:hypothetical protein GCM10010464_29170 [Pseudonocardia yunnanensis]